MTPKKPQLVWGIIIAAAGLFGVFNLNSKALYIVIYIIMILVGGLLIFLYIRSARRYNLLQKEQFDTKIEEQKLEKTRHSVERSVLEMEAARIQAETDKIKGGRKEVRVCKACDAATKGEYCEYCGRKIE